MIVETFEKMAYEKKMFMFWPPGSHPESKEHTCKIDSIVSTNSLN